jgi:hypothetical protein
VRDEFLMDFEAGSFVFVIPSMFENVEDYSCLARFRLKIVDLFHSEAAARRSLWICETIVEQIEIESSSPARQETELLFRIRLDLHHRF